METNAKLCFRDRDGRYQVIYGAAEDVQTLMTLVDDNSRDGRSYAGRVSQQLLRITIQAKRGLSSQDRVLGMIAGLGRTTPRRFVKLTLIRGGKDV